jgi:hypothetical protein
MLKALGCNYPKLSSVVYPHRGVSFFFGHQTTDILAGVSCVFGDLSQIFY